MQKLCNTQKHIEYEGEQQGKVKSKTNPSNLYTFKNETVFLGHRCSPFHRSTCLLKGNGQTQEYRQICMDVDRLG